MIGDNERIEIYKSLDSHRWFADCPCGDSRLTETWRQAITWVPVHLLTCHNHDAPSHVYVDIMPDMSKWEEIRDRNAYAVRVEPELLNMLPKPINFPGDVGEKTTGEITGHHIIPGHTGAGILINTTGGDIYTRHRGVDNYTLKPQTVEGPSHDWTWEVAIVKQYDKFARLYDFTSKYFDHTGKPFIRKDYSRYTVNVPTTMSRSLEDRLKDRLTDDFVDSAFGPIGRAFDQFFDKITTDWSIQDD